MKDKTTQQLEKQIRILKRDKELLEREIKNLSSQLIMMKNLNEQLTNRVDDLISKNDGRLFEINSLNAKIYSLNRQIKK